jgi:hypothetical protein
VGKALLASGRTKEQIANLHPLQVGVGLRNATEAVAMGVQGVVDSRAAMGHWVILKVDMTNAFNTISRQGVLHETQARCPSLFNYLRFCYQLHAPLFCGGQTLPSQTGVHQGCPVGPVGFALGIHSVIEHLQTIPGLLWQTWYLDDGIIVGDALAVTTAFHQLSAELAQQGLMINASKCELWGPGYAFCTNMSEVKVVPWDARHGITILGVPINYPGSAAQGMAAWGVATE